MKINKIDFLLYVQVKNSYILAVKPFSTNISLTGTWVNRKEKRLPKLKRFSSVWLPTLSDLEMLQRWLGILQHISMCCNIIVMLQHLLHCHCQCLKENDRLFSKIIFLCTMYFMLLYK